MTWPHSYAVILENITADQVECPFLGRRGITFKPGDKVAIIGNPLTEASNPRKWNGRASIRLLAETVANNQLAVLSIPGGDKEADNATVPIVDSNGDLLPGCRIEY